MDHLNVKGYACIGDSLTGGFGGGDVSYPDVLEELLEEEARERGADKAPEVVNLGVNGEDTITILGRAGASRGVDWGAVLAAAAADGVEWLVVECEKRCDGLVAAAGSLEFLRGVAPSPRGASTCRGTNAAPSGTVATRGGRSRRDAPR